MTNPDLLERLQYKRCSNTPEAVVLRFIELMCAWEKKCVLESRFNSEELEKIFALYCVLKSRNRRKRVGYRNPPEYGETLEKVVKTEVSEKRARVFTTTRFEFSKYKLFCYVLAKSEEGWKIGEKTIVCQDDSVVGATL